MMRQQFGRFKQRTKRDFGEFVRLTDRMAWRDEVRRNYGQSPAMNAGMDRASGDTLITGDADLQNDPAYIPDFPENIDEG